MIPNKERTALLRFLGAEGYLPTPTPILTRTRDPKGWESFKFNKTIIIQKTLNLQQYTILISREDSRGRKISRDLSQKLEIAVLDEDVPFRSEGIIGQLVRFMT